MVEFLKQSVNPQGGRPEHRDTQVAVKLSCDISLLTIGELIENRGVLNADPTLILPASIGGLDKGLLSIHAI